MRTVFLGIFFCLALAIVAAVAIRLWLRLDGVDIGFHGMLALFLGVIATLALGVGLMRLSWISHRRGLDH